MRLPILIFLLGTAGFLVLIWSMPHYAASLTGVIFLLLVQAMRHLRTIRLGGRPLGLALSWAIFYLLATDVGFSIARNVCDQLEWACQGAPSPAAIGKRLFQTPGKHLSMVRYEHNHNLQDESVSNGADIDTSKVPGARGLAP